MAARAWHSSPANTRRRDMGFSFFQGRCSDGTFGRRAQRARKFDILRGSTFSKNLKAKLCITDHFLSDSRYFIFQFDSMPNPVISRSTTFYKLAFLSV